MNDRELTVNRISVAGRQTFGDSVFPSAWTCGSEDAGLEGTLQWLRREAGGLLAEAEANGAVLFRGFPVAGPADFDAFVSAFGLENFPYDRSLSNAVRVNHTPKVFSANEAPAEVSIFLHHEMAQTPLFPAKLFFFCWKAAEGGGATPLCRSDALFERIAVECGAFARQCEQKGLRYTNIMPGENDAESGQGRSWQHTFRADTRDAVERRMRELGYSWTWLDDGCLKATTPVLPAVRGAGGGRTVFFNQLIAAFRGWKDRRNDPSKAITFGDGQPLDRDEVMQVAGLADELTFDLEWRTGDVALVDNILAMHGRRSFRGTRKVLASLADPRRQEAGPASA